MDRELLTRIDRQRLPQHIAIIMDGNGRWANRRSLPRLIGHRQGVKSVDHIVTLCCRLEIKALTLFAFSSENWQRPQSEIHALMGLLQEYLRRELDRMMREHIRFQTIGCTEDLPEEVQQQLAHVITATAGNTGLTLSLALSYGSRDEIVLAARAIARQVQQGLLVPEAVDVPLFAQHLYTQRLPAVDLLIRTGGELRLSNFLLWQLAYAELYFTEVRWPDFRENELLEAIIEFQRRERRYGMIGDQLISKRG